jgi:hypothetical protein
LDFFVLIYFYVKHDECSAFIHVFSYIYYVTRIVNTNDFVLWRAFKEVRPLLRCLYLFFSFFCVDILDIDLCHLFTPCPKSMF